MSFDTIQKSRTIIKILKNCGIWKNYVDNDDDEPGKRKISTFFYPLLIQTPVTFLFGILMCLELIFSSDLSQAVDVLYIFLTLFALVIKVLNAWYYDALAKTMFKEWQTNEMFQLKTLQERLMWQRSFKIFSRVAILYIFWCLAVVTGDFTVALFINKYQLPYALWMPFDHRDPLYFWYAYIYELFAMSVSCLTNITLDMLHCYMMQHLTLCFKLIAMRLENLNSQKFETNNNVTQKLVDIIKLDQKVKRYKF